MPPVATSLDDFLCVEFLPVLIPEYLLYAIISRFIKA